MKIIFSIQVGALKSLLIQSSYDPGASVTNAKNFLAKSF